MNLLESMQTMIRPVKISSSVPSILTVTTVRNVAVPTTGKFLHAIMYIHVPSVVISHACLQEQSSRTVNWICISCCLACLYSSLPTKASVQWKSLLAEYYSWWYQEQYHWHLPWCKKVRSAIVFLGNRNTDSIIKILGSRW